jgi:NADH-quinone oxidoreductase subunit L
MSDPLRHYLWLIPGLPLAASAITAFFGPRFLRQHSHWPCILTVIASFFVSFAVFLAVYNASHAEGAPATPMLQSDPYEWLRVDNSDPQKKPLLDASFTLRADALTAMMLVMITFVSSFIAIYSVGYMHGDPGYPRFFSEIALFVAAMTLLVLADNFVLLYAGWEGVGLCSYLLIGFWFTRDSAAAAARKAFLVTRLGDVGMFLGILLLWFTFDSVNYTTIFQGIKDGVASQGVLLAAALLLFCGAAGKSAQFPLHVWLPDAMEGPTPVSALIHAATMVTAGGYLVARCTPLFAAAPEAQLVVACIGGFTALLSALIALTQNDLKRVLAYSTISQLGYMFLALGCAIRPGGPELVTFAVTAAMFHLFTHAFFKALLFLSAGSVMHAMGGIDMRRFGGLRHKLPRTHWTFLCGALALAGFPLLSGWWSKDEILDAAYQAGTTTARSAGLYQWLLASAVVTAGLTAFYTFRAYFKTFHGPEKIPPEAGSHDHGATPPETHPEHTSHGGRAQQAHKAHGEAHESPNVMTIPLMVLAVFALGVGFLVGPVMPKSMQFGHFLARAECFAWLPGHPVEAHGEINWLLMGISSVVGLAGIGLAWLVYVRQPNLQTDLTKRAGVLYQWSLNKFYLDELDEALVVNPARAFATFLRRIDLHGVDALVDLIGQTPRLLGSLFRGVQNGLVQFYALCMVVGLAVFLLALLRWLPSP